MIGIRKNIIVVDMGFNKQRQKYSGWIAQIIQYECDHLEGRIV